MRDDNEGRTHAAAAESHAHVTTHRLRFNDTDRLGHVNNAVSGMPIGDGPQAVVIVRLELDFVAEMNWPGDVRIETEVSRLGGRSFQLRQRLISGGALCGQGITVLVVMDRAARKAVPIDPWRDSLTRWAAAEA
jgi:acyl-CoA thioester hydrolase